MRVVRVERRCRITLARAVLASRDGERLSTVVAAALLRTKQSLGSALTTAACVRAGLVAEVDFEVRARSSAASHHSTRLCSLAALLLCGQASRGPEPALWTCALSPTARSGWRSVCISVRPCCSSVLTTHACGAGVCVSISVRPFCSSALTHTALLLICAHNTHTHACCVLRAACWCVQSERFRWMGGARFSVVGAQHVIKNREYRAKMSYVAVHGADKTACGAGCAACAVNPKGNDDAKVRCCAVALRQCTMLRCFALVCAAELWCE